MEHTHHIGTDEILGPVNRSVDVAFGREIEDHPRFVFLEDRPDLTGIGDIPLDQPDLTGPQGGLDAFLMSGIGELVKNQDGTGLALEEVMNEIASNKACATCYDDVPHGSS
jgi:hypothetical protein